MVFHRYVPDRLSDVPSGPWSDRRDADADSPDLVYGETDPEDAPQASIGRNPMDFDGVRGLSGATTKQHRPAPTELTRRSPAWKVPRKTDQEEEGKTREEGEVELPEDFVLPPGLRPPQHLPPREPKEPPV